MHLQKVSIILGLLVQDGILLLLKSLFLAQIESTIPLLLLLLLAEGGQVAEELVGVAHHGLVDVHASLQVLFWLVSVVPLE